MKRFQEFLEKLNSVKQHNAKSKECINIFKILFDGDEEVTLHSRFISYLLSSNSNFLELFISKILKLSKNQFDIENCEVYPNEQDKKERWEIDILIINKVKQQAIIIENKIHANDSIHENNCINDNYSYRGQLERYYNTITRGVYKKGNDFESFKEEEKDFKCNPDKTYVYYLSLYKKPSEDTIGQGLKDKFIPNKHIINYHQIQNWLKLCIQETQIDSFLKVIIQQYLATVEKLSNDTDLALELKAITNEYWREAYECIINPQLKDNNGVQFLINEFDHIKWHTIAEFWNELKFKLGLSIVKDISLDDITEVARKKNKKSFGININIGNNQELYIVNDGNNGLTCGNPQSKNKKKGIDWYIIDSVTLFDFTQINTFKLINNAERSSLIDKIVKQVNILREIQ